MASIHITGWKKKTNLVRIIIMSSNIYDIYIIAQCIMHNTDKSNKFINQVHLKRGQLPVPVNSKLNYNYCGVL